MTSESCPMAAPCALAASKIGLQIDIRTTKLAPRLTCRLQYDAYKYQGRSPTVPGSVVSKQSGRCLAQVKLDGIGMVLGFLFPQRVAW